MVEDDGGETTHGSKDNNFKNRKAKKKNTAHPKAHTHLAREWFECS